MRFTLPLDLLPSNERERYAVLHGYFCDQRGKSWLEDEKWIVQTYWPNQAEYFVDDRIDEGLLWWDSTIAYEDIHKQIRVYPAYQISLNDSWTLYSWSKWLAKQNTIPDEIIILHVDYHNDLMSPRIAKSDDGYIDILTGTYFDIANPESVENAILSGAIGVGSFMVPLLHKINKVHLRHLCDGPLLAKKAQINSLKKEWENDTLIGLNSKRPKVTFERLDENKFSPENIHYKITNDTEEWISALPNVPILLHIDMDYFNCRYDGDSDWQHHLPRFDPAYQEIEKRIDSVCAALLKSEIKNRVVDIAIALSPGFYPAEFWKDSVARITQFFHRMKH